MGEIDNYFNIFKSKEENTKEIPINEAIKVFPMKKYESIMGTEKGQKLISKLNVFQRIIEDKHRASKRENYPSALRDRLLDFYKQVVIPQDEVDIEMSFKDWKESRKDPDMVLLGWQPEVAKFKKELEKEGVVIPIELLERINDKFKDFRYPQEKEKKDTILEDRIEKLTDYQINISNPNISDEELTNLRESLGGWTNGLIKRIIEHKLNKKEYSFKQRPANTERDKEREAVGILLEETKQDLKKELAILAEFKKFIEKVKADKAKMSEEEKFESAKEKTQIVNWEKAFFEPYRNRLFRWKNRSDFFNEMEKWIKFFKQSEKIKKELEKNNENIFKQDEKKSESKDTSIKPYWWADKE